MFVNNWSLICAGEYLILRGHVHESTTFVDGTYVHTSNVKSIIADEAMILLRFVSNPEVSIWLHFLK